MHVFPLDLRDGLLSDQWNAVYRCVLGLPQTKWQIEIKKPRRTKKQNDTIHPVFREISNHLESIGYQFPLGKSGLDPNPLLVKEVFCQLYLGKRTSEANTKELAQALDDFLRHMNSILIKAKAEPVVIKTKTHNSFIQNYEKNS